MAVAFDTYRTKIYPYRYAATIQVDRLTGGVPNNPKLIEGWLRSRFEESDQTIARMVAETMVERGVTQDEAFSLVAETMNVNGFKRDEKGLYIEGRQVKALIKEAASVAAASGAIPAKMGAREDGKGAKIPKSWIAEHVFVDDDRIYLGKGPDDVVTVTRPITVLMRQGRFAALKASEIVEDVTLTFTVSCDTELSESWWAAVWLTAERIGLGADRSQGSGTFRIVEWDRI